MSQLTTALAEEHDTRASSSPLRPVIGEWLHWSGLPPLHTRIPHKLGFGLDLGGTLSKIVLFEPDGLDDQSRDDYSVHESLEKDNVRAFLDQSMNYGETGAREPQLHFHSAKLGGTFTFLRFQTSKMANFLQIVRSNQLLSATSHIYAAGGGAYKFSDAFRDEINIDLVKTDEIQSLVSGITLLMQYYPAECYYYRNFNNEELSEAELGVTPASFSCEDSTPFLLVNIGTGISIMRVNNFDDYARVGGSSLGGGTFFGLCSLLTGCHTFSEALELASRGDSRNVDMLVRDIYGGDYQRFGLSGDTVASSFGQMMIPDKRKTAKPEDIAKALLVTLTNNIGSIALMLARAEKLERIIYVGNFLRGNLVAKRLLSFALNYWSGGTMKAYFMKHEGYLGACGALVQNWNDYWKHLDEQRSPRQAIPIRDPSSDSGNSTTTPSTTSSGTSSSSQ